MKNKKFREFPYRNITRNNIPDVDFHLHTTWTDGLNTSVEMYNKAISTGLKTVLFSEHARKASEQWFPKFAGEIRSLLRQECRALVGVEVKALDLDGNLDISSDISSECDLVIGSVHRFPGEKNITEGTKGIAPQEAVELEFKLAMAILDNPRIDILGHPFGMSISRFGVVPPDDKILALIDKAARKDVAFEINAAYSPDPWKWLDWCNASGAQVSLGSDAHEVKDVGRILRILRGEEAP